MAVNPNTVGLIVALLTLLFYLYGMLVSITTIESNDCKMTYMFEYPQFVVSNRINHFWTYLFTLFFRTKKN